ncbi:MAG: DUF1838 family protein [Woeseiaceae bacterium]
MKHLLFVILAITVSSPVFAEEVTLEGRDASIFSQKTSCGTTEQGKLRYGIWEGRAYSRVPGEKDRHLFNLLGINVRHCSTHSDDVRGNGYRSVSREIMVYLDKDSGEMIDTWMNPWTGKEIEIVHVANDPVNARSIRWEKNEDGDSTAKSTLRRYGDMVATSFEVPLFYPNPLGGDYQQYVGGTYHAMEIFNTFYDAEKALDASASEIGDSRLAWSRVAQWLPWLEMGSRPGIMIFNATGFSTFDKNLIPEKLVAILNEHYPLYWTPPPLDDKRPNETSWTVFKKHLGEMTKEAATH